ncbi:hypothetical protein [Pseudomarimonas arenosa]|uniref:Uncharacterized protein n=1 Tax=Pseudomarimonas arenosa TaxID=2774145 RepID=A0AAW3ZHR1_9GAMM|nr:hypothetical protein [Pseudomarimonas arenosa]MBD8524279.1 hypothetical protein [Pseudomarimonas arenosa]
MKLWISLFILVSLPTQLSAHETIPLRSCSGANTQVEVIGEFNFSRAELIAAARAVEQELGPEGLIEEGLAERGADGRCGIVDRWNMAAYIAQQTCIANTGIATAFAEITAPNSALTDDHHTRFGYSAGMSGMCAVCLEIE